MLLEHEIFANIRFIDNSSELTYEYDAPAEDEPYIYATITHELKKSDAMATFFIEWNAQKLIYNATDDHFDFVVKNNFYQAGDRSHFADITYDGNNIGHCFVAQKGSSVYAYTITGFLMDNAEMWHELFDHRIAKFNAK